jgi:Skp family chaperone for outer membrane proteins
MNSLKRSILLSILALTAAGALAAEPGHWERFKAYVHAEKEAAVADGKKLLAEMDAKIEELKKQAASSKAETKVAYENSMKELQAKRDAASAQMEKLQKSSTEAWQATRDGFADAYRDLHTSYEKAGAAFKK